MDRRLLLAGVGLVLVAGLVAVLAFTGSEADATQLAYDVEWPVEPGPATMHEGELEEGRNETHAFELGRRNVTNVTVELEWEDDVGEPDAFRVWVSPPNGSPVERSSRNGTIEMAFDVGSVPAVDQVEAANRSQARERTGEEVTLAGTGTWRVRVTLEDAPGRRPLPGASDVETEPDGSNSYELTFGHHAFYAEVGEARPPAPDG